MKLFSKLWPSILGVIFLLAWAHTGHSEPYIGVQYSDVEYKDTVDLDFETVSGIVGYKLDDVISIEARYGEGTDKDQLNGYNVTIDKYMNIYGKMSWDNDTNITPYAMLGYTRGKLEVEGISSTTETDFSYGAGIGFAINDSLSVSAEYVVLLDKDDYEFNQTSVSLTYTF